MRLRTIGNALIAGTILVYSVEQVGRNTVSYVLGRLYCGDNYMRAGGYLPAEPACGFDMDMYLALLLLVLFVSGIFMRLIARYRGSSESVLES